MTCPGRLGQGEAARTRISKPSGLQDEATTHNLPYVSVRANGTSPRIRWTLLFLAMPARLVGVLAVAR